MSISLLVAAALALAPAAAPEAPEPESPWRVLSFYEHPEGTHNAILQNASSAPLMCLVDRLEAAADQDPVHVWWTLATPERVAPGETTWLRFALKRAKSRPGEVIASLQAGTRIPLQPGGSPLVPVYCVYQGDSLYTYWRNDHAEPVTLNAVHLQGVESGDTPPLEIPPGATGLRVLRPFRDAPPSGTEKIFQLDTSNGSGWAGAPLCSASDFAVQWEHEAPAAFVCPTHQHGPWDVVGNKIASWRSGMAAAPATVHFCRNRLPAGLEAFAACAPRAVVNLQASNLTRGEAEPWPGWFDIAGLVSHAVEPGGFVGLIEDASLYGGAYSQLASPEDPPLRDEEIRALVYLTIASGAKGLLFRPAARPHDYSAIPISSTDPERPGDDDRSRFERVMNEVRPLIPSLAVSCPLSPIGALDLPVCRVRALQCGEERLFVVAYAANHEAGEAELKVPLPPGLAAPTQWKSILSDDALPVSVSDGRCVWRVPLDATGLAAGFLEP
ncbi:MAG: hypothetical protein GC168_09430 [Candidatus Hydrogenedens sp.]|nr:hypothetical protein [Candidatus Hydrogenedens sp.]